MDRKYPQTKETIMKYEIPLSPEECIFSPFNPQNEIFDYGRCERSLFDKIVDYAKPANVGPEKQANEKRNAGKLRKRT